jgi:hypothetical protein
MMFTSSDIFTLGFIVGAFVSSLFFLIFADRAKEKP